MVLLVYSEAKLLLKQNKCIYRVAVCSCLPVICSVSEVLLLIIGFYKDPNKLKEAKQDLTEYLEKHFSKKVILLIDEYDAPIQKAYSKNYYEQIISVFRGMFGGALKGNSAVEKTILTGIIRVSKESLFSAVNNVEIYSVLEIKYSEYFGFTEGEVAKMLQRANIDALDKVCALEAK